MKFNTLIKRMTGGNTTNLAGGRSFTQSPKGELVSILLTATLGDQFYRSGDTTAARVKQLVAATEDKSFAAKGVISARAMRLFQSSSPKGAWQGVRKVLISAPSPQTVIAGKRLYQLPNGTSGFVSSQAASDLMASASMLRSSMR